MPTSRVQTPTSKISKTGKTRYRTEKTAQEKRAFVLIEMIIVLGIVALLTGIASINLIGKATQSSFKNEAAEIVNTLKMAQNAAAQTGRRYLVLFDFIEQSYTMKQIRTIEELIYVEDSEEGEMISQTQLSDQCMLEFITFDDMTDTRDMGQIEDQAKLKSYFIAGRSGWQNGGKIAISDSEGNLYSIIINRMNKSIELKEGDIDIYFLEPKENLRF